MTTSKPLLIFYLHKPPYPYDSGTNQRIKTLVEYLRISFRIGLIVPRTFGPVEELQHLFDAVWIGERRGTYVEKVLSRLSTYFKKLLLWRKLGISSTTNPFAIIQTAAAWRLWKVCQAEKPALIMVQKIFNTVPATAIARHFSIPVVLDVHDLYILGQRPRSNRFPNAKIEDEKALLWEYDLLIAIQHEDARNLKLYLPEIPTVLAMHPFNAVSIQEKPNDAKRLLFIGSASQHNIDTIQSFISDIFPHIVKIHPDVVLEICGSVAGMLSTNPVNQNVMLTGPVSDVAAAYGRATLVVNPIRMGGGLKIKTVEGMAYGKCVVTTPVGAEGIVAADTALAVVPIELFHEKINTLLQKPELIEEYEEATSLYSASHLTPQSCYAELVNKIHSLLENRQ